MNYTHRVRSIFPNGRVGWGGDTYLIDQHSPNIMFNERDGTTYFKDSPGGWWDFWKKFEIVKFEELNFSLENE